MTGVQTCALPIYMYLVTADNRDYVIVEIKNLGLYPYFKKIYTGANYKTNLIKRIIFINKLKTTETVFVGDTSDEVRSGHRAGIRVVLISWGLQTKSCLKEAQADYLIDRISELKKIVK